MHMCVKFKNSTIKYVRQELFCSFSETVHVIIHLNDHYLSLLLTSDRKSSRSENCRKWVLANRHSRNWELYSSRLHTESYNTPHWSDRHTGFPRIL